MINKQTKEVLDEFYDKILGLEFTCDDQLEDDLEEDVKLVEFTRERLIDKLEKDIQEFNDNANPINELNRFLRHWIRDERILNNCGGTENGR